MRTETPQPSPSSTDTVPSGTSDDGVAARSPMAGPAPHYRPQLDGLRAVAVYLVVAFHAGLASFSGGFVGVDVFFVLSGYLVTQLLLRDLAASARIDLRRFYSRRFRRLLPAAFVAILVTAGVYAAVAAPANVKDALGGLRSAFLYVANWHFIGQSKDYFAAGVNTNPVLHFWSLAVEEQFYLLWPLALGALYALTRRYGRRQWHVVRAVVGAGLVVSLLAALHVAHTDLSRAYYGTDTRAYELLAGAALALTPQLFDAARRRRALLASFAPVNLAVIVLLATSAIHLGAIARGAVITAATCALILTLVTTERGPVAWLLSSPPAVYLGRISYGTYLWHWPVIVIATLRFHPGGLALFALTALVATGIASLSYQLVERPVRESRALDRRRSLVIATGLVISIVSGLVVVPAMLHGSTRGSNVAAAGSSATNGGGWRVPVPANLDLLGHRRGEYQGVDCYKRPLDKCIVVRGTGKRLLVIGDSHAFTLTPAFAEVARRHSLTLAVAFAFNCAWQQGQVARPPFVTTSAQDCRDRQNDWYSRVVPQFDPDIVVLAERGRDDPANPISFQGPDQKQYDPGDAGYEATLRETSTRTLDRLRRPGRKTVILEPLPLAPAGFNPNTCLSGAKYLDDCRYVASARPAPSVTFFRSLADEKQVWSVDLDRAVCPYFPICDPVVDGIAVKRDPQHLTAAFSAHLGDAVDQVLQRNGIVS